MKEKTIKTKDNIKISFNHFERGFKNVLIIFPGWFMTKDSKVFRSLSEYFCQYIDVIILDFRGHGKSKGYYTFTQKEIFDVESIIQYAKSQYKEINIMGFSLGGSLSLISGTMFSDIKKIIAISPACDFNKIENHFWRPEAWIQTFKKTEVKRWLSIRASLPFGKKIKPIDIVDKIETPVLFIAGEKDPTVYPWHTEELYKKAVCKKKYKLFKNCNHAEDLYIQNKELFVEVCTSWLFSE